jgi:hypothetical protein
MKYSLRSLVIAVILSPPLLAGLFFGVKAWNGKPEPSGMNKMRSQISYDIDGHLRRGPAPVEAMDR